MRTPTEIAASFAPREALGSVKSLFLVGIGGAGMSGLVGLALAQGYRVSGSDSTASPITDALPVPVTIGHFAQLPDDVQALVLTDAIDLQTSPEVRAARERGLPLFRRSQLLGWLLRNHKVAAVTGTHGKTTTTGFLAAAMIGAGLDPVVVVGAEVPSLGGAVVQGGGDWAVVEACEAYDGMHDLEPSLVLLTNLELDHADFHGDFEHLKASMVRFAKRLPKDGHLVYAGSDSGAAEVALDSGVASQAYVADPRLDLRLKGAHNRLNASGALAAFRLMAPNASIEEAERGVSAFTGAERRLQVLHDGEVTVIDDYAHHPTEIAASIQALREGYPGRRLVVVYQPHLYSRTKEFGDEFPKALSAADFVVITDIYPAREDPIPGVSSSVIADALTVPYRYVPSRHRLPSEVRRLLQPGDVVVGMGAGTIDKFAPALIAELGERPLAGLSRPVRVAILSGGDSSEREVSLLSGRAIHAALQERGYETHLVDAAESLLRTGDVSLFLGPSRPDVAFLALHGTHAEDGAIQGLLELLGIPYTGSGIQASALAMDKAMTKRQLELAGVRCPKGTVVERGSEPVEMDAPLVVKPNAEGSTVGVTFVREAAELGPALTKAFNYGSSVLVEELIEGIEISVPVLCGEVLPPVEIEPNNGVYDFQSKYIPGATREIIPARLPASVIAEAQEIALKTHQTLGCQGASRTDMIVRGVELFVLEVNTLPGMTPTSLLPNSAAAAGIQFPELCERLLKDAMERSGA
jgi:D-alanine--D-alanine ligase